MDLHPFVTHPACSDEIGIFLKKRLKANFAVWPKQGLRLISYMAWPNDPIARNAWINANTNSRRSIAPDESIETLGSRVRPERQSASLAKADSHWAVLAPQERFLSKLKLVQQHWARMADIFRVHYEISQGQHQIRRGGASIGKAISLIDATARSKGTAQSKLWEIWKNYKDAGHLIAAALLVSGDAHSRNRIECWGIPSSRLQPLHVTFLVPDFVLSVALTYERYGLRPGTGRRAPMLDPEHLWRIPADIGLTAVDPPCRRLTREDQFALNARRAGNRGTH